MRSEAWQTVAGNAVPGPAATKINAALPFGITANETPGPETVSPAAIGLRPCSAVLLAGGKSSRMGRDKAFLEIDGKLLWRRQMEKLHQLRPVQIMLSGPQRNEWSDYTIVADEIENAGPLAGVAAALQRCTALHLVVLAVDLPMMTSEFLQSLLELCSDDRGVVPRNANGFEPLAAVYPASCAFLASMALRSGDFSLQSFVRKGVSKKILVERTIAATELPLFTNLNRPADL
jgi:molybdopterin-guanine dinucleotide biosynthesis protein A